MSSQRSQRSVNKGQGDKNVYLQNRDLKRKEIKKKATHFITVIAIVVIVIIISSSSNSSSISIVINVITVIIIFISISLLPL